MAMLNNQRVYKNMFVEWGKPNNGFPRCFRSWMSSEMFRGVSNSLVFLAIELELSSPIMVVYWTSLDYVLKMYGMGIASGYVECIASGYLNIIVVIIIIIIIITSIIIIIVVVVIIIIIIIVDTVISVSYPSSSALPTDPGRLF